MSTGAAAETAAWHTRQRQTMTFYKPPVPVIPTDYNCPTGACATPPPPAPIKHSSEEGFAASATATAGDRAWLLVMAAAGALFIAATRLIKAN